MNDKANEGKNISNRQTAHSMPSQIHEEGRVPMTKHPMHPRTRIEVSNGPQMAIPLIQMQSLDERSTPIPRGRDNAVVMGRGDGIKGIPYTKTVRSRMTNIRDGQRTHQG
jgi:hypothetical protein